MRKTISFHRIRLWAIIFFLAATGTAHAELSPDARSAVEKGIIAAQQQDYLLALRYFQEARKFDPEAPEIYGDLGMAESKMPGRELRAIVWFGAYLAANPHAANAAAVRKAMEQLDVKSQSNLAHLIQTAQDAALLIPYENGGNYTYVRDSAVYNVSRLWAVTGDFDAAQKAIGLISPKDFMGIKKQAEKSVVDAKTEMATDKAEAGDFAGARKMAELLPIEDQDHVNEAIALMQARAGNILDAQNTAGFIHGSWKSYAQREIAEAQAKAGDIAGAQKTADLIQDAGSKQDAEKAIAEAQIKAADFVGAQKTVALISNQSDKESFEAEIALAQVEMGEVAGAQKSAMLLPAGFWKKSLVEYKIAITQAAAGDFTAAKYTAELIMDEKDNYKGQAEVEIAKAQIKAGDFDGARETILVAISACEHADDDYKRYSVQSTIAKMQAETGDIAAAQATAGQIKDVQYRGISLRAIADVQLKAGDIAGARKTIAMAQNAAALIMSGKDAKLRDWEGAEGAIAELQADAGDIADAQKTAESITDASVKSGTAVAIAEAQIKAGDIAAARASILNAQKIASVITGTYYKNGAQTMIAQAKADVGDIDSAKDTLGAIDDAASRITVEGAIAAAEAKAGDTAGAHSTILLAKKTAERITDMNQRIYAECDIAVAQAKVGDKAAAHAAFLNLEIMAQQITNATFRNYAEDAIAAAQTKAGIKLAVRANKASKKIVRSAPIARAKPAPARSPQPVLSVADWTKRIDDQRIYTSGGMSYGLDSPFFTDLPSYLKTLPATDPRTIFSALNDTIWRVQAAQRDIEKMLWKLQAAQRATP